MKNIDLTGKIFNNITVISFGRRRPSGTLYWLCRCPCGNEMLRTRNRLLYGKNVGCRSCQNEQRNLELIGKKFGPLTVIKRGRCSNGDLGWFCECDCGGEITVKAKSLKLGRIGCKNCEHERRVKSASKHGAAGDSRRDRLYVIWHGMKDRCNNKKNRQFRIYGGKGIKVFNAWNDYSIFREWALLNDYKDSLSIDRVDPDKNYEPSNCEWVTLQENSRRSIITNRIKKQKKAEQEKADYILGQLGLAA